MIQGYANLAIAYEGMPSNELPPISEVPALWQAFISNWSGAFSIGDSMQLKDSPYTWETYCDYLRSDEWRALRKVALAEQKWTCQVCGSTKILHVHHIRYKNLTDVTPQDLVVMCNKCHDDFHYATKRTGKGRDVELQQIQDTVLSYRESKQCAHREQKLAKKRERRVLFAQQKPQPFRVKKDIRGMVGRCAMKSYSLDAVDQLIYQLQSYQSRRRQMQG